jgi:hypothetical protein
MGAISESLPKLPAGDWRLCFIGSLGQEETVLLRASI